MMKKFGRWLYGDRSYYLAHIVIGTFFMVCIGLFIHFILEKPLDIVLKVISDDTIALSASLLGFQLAGVSILLSLGSNSKLETLRDISSDSMVYKIFLSSVSMFLLSIMLMIAVLNLFKNLPLSSRSLQVKSIIGYASVASFAFGMIFLFSSIRLLKWCCSQ